MKNLWGKQPNLCKEDPWQNCGSVYLELGEIWNKEKKTVISRVRKLLLPTFWLSDLEDASKAIL